jgi:lipoyl(octanoyl) transferase
MIDWVNLPSPAEYLATLNIMEDRLSAVIDGKSSETVFLLEHEEVYTAGTSHAPEELLEKSKIPVIQTGRGGKYTYHGPGQSVIYPIIDLRKENRAKDIKLYIRNLELVVINTLKQYNLEAYTIEDKVGIWVNKNNIPAKIGAIGVRIKKWVTYHGIAVNITTNLQNYKGIIPCGISDFPVTSLHELGIEISTEQFNSTFKKEFEKIF